MRNRSTMMPALVALMIVALAGAGCATKKFVLGKLNPLSKRVDKVEQTSEETSKELGEVGDTASRAEELARGADRKAEDASGEAKTAQRGADEAGRSAAEANARAEESIAGLRDLDQRVSSLDDFRLVATETVLFDFGSSRLDEDAKTKLDSAAFQAPGDVPYVFEVEGFTDATGSRDYNLALSGRRADAVVRYLAGKHSIPLRRIHNVGMGSEKPTADNETKEGRKMNRRVEVKLYAPKEVVTTARQLN